MTRLLIDVECISFSQTAGIKVPKVKLEKGGKVKDISNLAKFSLSWDPNRSQWGRRSIVLKVSLDTLVREKPNDPAFIIEPKEFILPDDLHEFLKEVEALGFLDFED